MCKVSVIIPVYNVEKYLHRCIDSVVNQTLKDIEIILVDDKSTDHSPEICDQYALKDRRIKVIHKEQNEGLGLARNTGLSVANGDYVAFIDSDDFIDLNMYQELYAYAQKEKCDTVYCSLSYYKNEKSIHPFQEVSEPTCWQDQEIKNFLLDMIGPLPSFKSDVKYMVSVCKAIYYREIIQRNKLKFVSERVSASEDMIFHIDYLTKSQKIGFIPLYYYFYYQNNSSITRTYKTERILRLKNFLIEIEKKMAPVYPNEYKLRLYRKYLHYIRVILLILIKNSPNTKTALKAIRKECQDKFYHGFITEYPYGELPIKHKTLFLAIKYKLSLIIWLILTLKKNKN